MRIRGAEWVAGGSTTNQPRGDVEGQAEHRHCRGGVMERQAAPCGGAPRRRCQLRTAGKEGRRKGGKRERAAAAGTAVDGRGGGAGTVGILY